MQDFSLAKISQADVKQELDDPPSREEIKKATMQLKVGKSQALMEFQQQCSTSFRICSLTVGRKGLPQDLRDAVIVSLYKNNGENQIVQTSEASVYSPLQAESWLASC